MTRELSYNAGKNPTIQSPLKIMPLFVILSMNQTDGIHELLSMQPFHNAQTFQKYAAPQAK